MAGYQERPTSVIEKATDDGTYRTIFIEKHDKDADLRKMIGRYEKTVGAVIQERTEEGVWMKYPVKNAEEHQRKARERANRLAKTAATISPDEQNQGIASVSSNTIESVSAKELMD